MAKPETRPVETEPAPSSSQPVRGGSYRRLPDGTHEQIEAPTADAPLPVARPVTGEPT